MKTFLLAAGAALALALAHPVFAQSGPDPRMIEVDYAPGAVYRLSGAYRTATQIVFGADEVIRHVAVGDSVSWEIAAEGSVLFLKPRERLQATNLLVVTDRRGLSRHYAFELAARDPGDRSAIAYQMRFRYPADVQAAAVASLQIAAEAIESRLVDLALEQGAVEGPRNLAYSVQGATELQPSEVSDNGRFTVLRFPASQPIPAIFSVSAEGEESLVPFDVRGEFVVIHAVSPGLRLRRGRAVLCIFNEAFDPRGVSTGSGTSSPHVERSLSDGAHP
ncbi:TrbG/VirB9 family P-type conjugative transfer protein [Brevundimonas sp.]|uniref:TrbG/VirB9 family P-type conjugative transfer protein n=1 Tax=Brevundimonas sp. TaxID=1871086 RepID=UPI001A1DA522|nr:TrbG/VirB9 family P-type conjugative transfer protein [Brevundimonas sp.]MBJ7483484.1 TrbG/VirB9 family P-type conjugative transfer protein [Brevundimonas sp.]